MPEPFISTAVGVPAIVNLLGLLMKGRAKPGELQELAIEANQQLLNYQ